MRELRWRVDNSLIVGVLGVLAMTVSAAPARAQLAGSINVESDLRFRGRSLSAARPTATAQLSYDHVSGFYLNGSATGVAGRDEAALLGAQANVGYAKRLGPSLSIDAGLVRSEYRSTYSGGRSARYTEGYVGLTLREVTARVYYSPHYFLDGLETVYGEIDAGFRPARNWRLSAHAGALVYLRTPSHYYGSRATQYDWRLGASRQLGQFEVHAALSSGGPGKDYYNGRVRNRTALTAGASWNF